MKIQKWLLPSKANKYHPHLLRPVGLTVVVALLLGINIVQNLVSAQSFQVLGVATSISASDVITLSNQERINNGLPALNYNAQLTAAAQAKARDMFAKNYWAHYAPDGTSPWDFIIASGYSYSTAGENLAKDFETSSGVVQGWMNSPAHRANILSGSFKDTGVAVMDGTLQGSPTTLVVAMYGSQKIAPPPPAPAATHPAAQPPAPAASSPASTPPASTPESNSTTPAAADTTPAPVNATPAPTKTTPTATAATAEKTRVIAERSVSSKQSRTWAQNSTLLLLATLLLVNVMKHTAVWRLKRRGLRHVWLRSHPAAQYALLLVAIAANVASGAGVIR